MKKLIQAGLVLPLLLNPVATAASGLDTPTETTSTDVAFSDELLDFKIVEVFTPALTGSEAYLIFTATNKSADEAISLTFKDLTINGQSATCTSSYPVQPGQTLRGSAVVQLDEPLKESETLNAAFKLDITAGDKSYSSGTIATAAVTDPDADKTDQTTDSDPAKEDNSIQDLKLNQTTVSLKSAALDSDKQVLVMEFSVKNASESDVDVTINSCELNDTKLDINHKHTVKTGDTAAVTASVSVKGLNLSSITDVKELVIQISTSENQTGTITTGFSSATYLQPVDESSIKPGATTGDTSNTTTDKTTTSSATDDDLAEITVPRNARMVLTSKTLDVKFLGASISKVNNQTILGIELDTTNNTSGPLDISVKSLTFNGTKLSAIYYPAIEGSATSSDYMMAFLPSSVTKNLSSAKEKTAVFQLLISDPKENKTYETESVTIDLGETDFATHPEIDAQIKKISGLYNAAEKKVSAAKSAVSTAETQKKEAESALEAKKKELQTKSDELAAAKKQLETSLATLNEENAKKAETLKTEKEALEKELESLKTDLEEKEAAYKEALKAEDDILTDIEALESLMEDKDKTELTEEEATKLLSDANNLAKELTSKIADMTPKANLSLDPYEKAVNDAINKMTEAQGVFRTNNLLLDDLQNDYESMRENFIKAAYIASADPKVTILLNNYMETAEAMDDAIEIMRAYMDEDNLNYKPDYSESPLLPDSSLETPEEETPGSTTPGTDTPGTDTPGSDIPYAPDQTDPVSPGADTPSIDSPDNPSAGSPGTSTPSDDEMTPGTDSPGSDTPTDSTTSGSSSTDTPSSSYDPDGPTPDDSTSGTPGTDSEGTDTPSTLSASSNTLSLTLLSETTPSSPAEDPDLVNPNDDPTAGPTGAGTTGSDTPTGTTSSPTHPSEDPDLVNPDDDPTAGPVGDTGSTLEDILNSIFSEVSDTLGETIPTDPNHVIYKANEAIRDHEDAAAALSKYSEALETLYCMTNEKLQDYVKALFAMRDARNAIYEAGYELDTARSNLAKAQEDKANAQKALDELLAQERENTLTIKTLENRKKTIEQMKNSLASLRLKYDAAKEASEKKRLDAETAQKLLDEKTEELNKLQEEIDLLTKLVTMDDVLAEDYVNEDECFVEIINAYLDALESSKTLLKEIEDLQVKASTAAVTLTAAQTTLKNAEAERDAYAILLEAAKAGKTTQEKALQTLLQNKPATIIPNTTDNTTQSTTDGTGSVSNKDVTPSTDGTTNETSTKPTTTTSTPSSTTTKTTGTSGTPTSITQTANTGAGAVMGLWSGIFGVSAASGAGFSGFKFRRLRKRK